MNKRPRENRCARGVHDVADLQRWSLIADPAPRSARWWRAKLALHVAEQRFVNGYPPADARRRGFFDTITDLVESDADLRLLPSPAAEPLARAALAALGVDAPEPP